MNTPDEVSEPLLLHELEQAFQASLRAVCASHHVGIEDCLCTLRGTLTVTPRGCAYADVALHISLQVAPGDLARAEELLQATQQEFVATHAVGVPFTVNGTVKGTVTA